LTSGNEGRTAYAFGSDGSRGLVLIGAAGGAVYAKRPNAYQKPRWDVTVKMDRGDTRVLQQRYEPLLREGDRVRVLGTQIELVES
jgi:outer membrane lipoprotein SlyB